jgi:hypothetical protein
MRNQQQQCSSPAQPHCPWQHLGLAPGFLELIQCQGRAWAREYELGKKMLERLFNLSIGQHAILRHHTEKAVAGGFCSRTEGLLLLVATAPDGEDLFAAVGMEKGAWIEAAMFGSGAVGADEPELAARITEWPLQPWFPREAPPPEWEEWQDLSAGGTLAAAARKVLGAPPRRGLRLPGIEQPEEAPR